MKFSRDYETRSIVDLQKAGAYRYMAHPTTSVWCVSFAIDEQPVGLWVPGQPVPPEFSEAAADGAEAWAWNCAFERTVERYIMAPRHGFPEFALANQRCSMVTAKEMGLPASLELAAPAVGLPISKDMAGRRLMLQMSKPRKVELADGWADIPFDAVRVQEMDAEGWEAYETPSGKHIARVRWWNDSDKVLALGEYCKQDTEVERGVGRKLYPMKASELAAWHLDQTINDRGVLVDQRLANAAVQIVNEVAEGFDAEMKRLTNFAVPKCSAVAKIVAYLATVGVETPSLNKEDLERLLADDMIPAEARAVLELRKEAAKASVKKIKALLKGVSPEDGRAKGMLQFFAASTGRWCLAEGTPVLVCKNGVVSEKPVESVDFGEKVWDGVDWVEHDGVVFSGVKEVITHDGLTATPEHKVYLSDTEAVTLGEAQERGLRLWRGNRPT